MKRCVICGETKPLEDMKKDKRYPDGRATRCKSCHNRPINNVSRKRFSIQEKESWPSGYRICLKCEVMLPYLSFSKNSNKWNGIEDMCRTCRKPISQQYYNKWLKNSPETRMFLSAKARAQRDNVPFTIAVSDIIIPDICPVLGILLERNAGKNKYTSPSLDRFIPELGYVPENITVISWRANWLKQNATVDEIQKIAKWMTDKNNYKE